MSKFRIIGDVHGLQKQYVRLAEQADASFQLGDLGFDYSYMAGRLDPKYHKVLGGNHDNYSTNKKGEFCRQPPHFLGDFGVHSVDGVGDFFYVRGGDSIDKDARVEGEDWWPDEQLSEARLDEAINVYGKIEPTMVITHECPARICDLVSTMSTWNGKKIQPSLTARALDLMWSGHKPALWVFGHHHRMWEMRLGPTKFVCLPELGVMDFD